VRRQQLQLGAAKARAFLAERRAREAEERLAALEQHPPPAATESALTRPSGNLLIEGLLPDAPIPSPAQALQAQSNAEARWGLLQEFGAYTSEDIADRRSQAKNRHALANRWRSEGKVFAVEYRGQRLYPGFQFDPETFAPEPAVAAVLAALPRERMSDWEVALWWTAGNGWLDGERPVELLGDESERLTEAAGHLAEPSPF
jgi:hypothetical protein